jgi:hypothetical protein
MADETPLRARQCFAALPLALLAAMAVTCSRDDDSGRRAASSQSPPSVDLPLSASPVEPAADTHDDSADTEVTFSTVPPNTVDVRGLTAVTTIMSQPGLSDVHAGLCCYRDPTGQTAHQKLIGGDIGLLQRGETVTYSVELPCGVPYQCDASIKYDRCPLPPNYNAYWLLGVRRGFTQACPGAPVPPGGPDPPCQLTQNDCPAGPFNPDTCSCDSCPPLYIWNGQACVITG